MRPTTKMPAEIAQPGKTRVGGFCNGTGDIEVKNRLGRAGVQLGKTPPTGIARARSAVPVDAVADEIDIHMIVVSRPVLLEIIQK